MKWYAQIHVEKARFNFDFSEHIAGLGDDYNGWRVTVLFYSAVHLIEAYLVDQRRGGAQSHTKRDDLIRKLPRLAAIREPYAHLEALSRLARYGTNPLDLDEVAEAVADHEAVYYHIAALLGVPPLHPEPEAEEDEPPKI